jgi:hypothetical protein
VLYKKLALQADFACYSQNQVLWYFFGNQRIHFEYLRIPTLVYFSQTHLGSVYTLLACL